MDGTELTLDEIMSGDEPAVVETPSEQPTAETPEATSQPRDENGKFAAKAKEPQPEPEGQDEAEAEGEPEGGQVPQKAIHAERQRRKQAEADSADLRRQLQEMQGQIRLLSERAMQAPQVPKEQPKPKVFWQDPNSFVSDSVNEQIAPIQQQLQQQRFGMSRMMAEDKFGADVVKAADEELGRLVQSNDPAVAGFVEQIKQSVHPYADLVGFINNRKALADIGNDPAGYRSRLEAEIRAQIAAEANGGQQNPAPSSTKPLTKLPQSLNRLPGGGNSAGEVDVSDAGLFKHAMGG